MTWALLSTIHGPLESNEAAPAPQQRGATRHVVPEGLVAELAGVRQARAPFLFATGGHAEVAATVGHLRRRRHVFTGGRGRHPGKPRWVILTI